MSTIDERRRIAEAGTGGRDGFGTRVVLQPIAAPSILGLMGFFGGTLIVASHLAGWYGSSDTPMFLFPFAAFFGGLAQFMAGMWSYRARDGVATLAHGTWGAFWLAYGLLWLLVATGQLETGRTMDVALGFWFVALAAVTYSAMLGALFESGAITFVLFTLATGSALAATGLLADVTIWERAAGWTFVVSAVAAWYTATAMVMHAASGRTILPLFKYRAEANVPGRQPTHAIELEWAEPGVKQGQ